jgi:predicted nucleic acid-binding Zn finger protein
MATTSLPASREEATTRVQRGIALYRERADEIERTGIHTYRVPSCTGSGSYTVYSDLRWCTCPDHPRAKAAGERCKHVIATEIVASKRRAARRLIQMEA